MKTLSTLALLFLLGACSTSPPVGVSDNVVVTPGPDGTQIVDVVAGSYWFRPQRISVVVGKPVELRITRDTTLVPHNFTLQAPEAQVNVDVDLGSGLNFVRFTPAKVGEYRFFCARGSHDSKGMHGTLVVRAE